MDDKEKKEILEKIENTIYSADKFNEMSFRMVLEGLVNKGGEEAEYLMVRYVNSQDLDLSTRINIIRVVGYLQSSPLLIPLKRIIDLEENIQLKKEAIISVSKYNNRQALNILNNAVSHIKNPLLLQLINNEISKIKKNNPIFALLPRFLDSEKDPKNFRVTIDILKRILTPTDSAIFVAYLNCGKPIIEEGAFEILCHTADMTSMKPIWNFYQERFSSVPCINQPVCDQFYSIALKIKTYFLKYPTLVDSLLDELGTQLFYIKDIRIREVYITIICQSQAAPFTEFISKVYDSEPGLRMAIIRDYSGNNAAVDMLFEKLKTADVETKKLLLKSILNSQKGINYYYNAFPSCPLNEQEMIIDCLPYGSMQNLSEFICMILKADRVELKGTIMSRIKAYYEFSVKDILFDPARENEFYFMEQEYLDTILHLFPVTAIKRLLEKIAYTELPVVKIKKFLKKISEIAESGFVLQFQNKEFISHLFRRIILINNPEVNALFLEAFAGIKTFDVETVRNIDQALGVFMIQRESKVNVNETSIIRKIRKNLTDLNFEIRIIEEGNKALNQLFSQKIPDIDYAANQLNRFSLAVPVLIQSLTQSMEKYLSESSADEMNQWIKFFHRFPMLGLRLKDKIEAKAKELKGYSAMDIGRLIQSLPEEPYKIVIHLNDRGIAAALRDQCAELIPEITVDTETGLWHEGDMLVCDQETLKDFILQNALPSKKLFLLLDKRSDFTSFKSYNPRPLVKPFSAYRIMKEILRDIYL